MLFAGYSSFSQGITAIHGKITDTENGINLASVIIDMQYGGYASSSNYEGEFVFQFPTVVIDSEEVTFSKIGY